MDGSIADIRIDFVVGTLESLLESNKEQRRTTTHELLSNYYDGKIEAYTIAISTLKNAKEIFRDDYAKKR